MSVSSQEAGERTDVKGLRVCVDLSGSFAHGGQRGKRRRMFALGTSRLVASSESFSLYTEGSTILPGLGIKYTFLSCIQL
jgi:hypothetical protein